MYFVRTATGFQVNVVAEDFCVLTTNQDRGRIKL
jgi:hypothetical protein